MATTKLLPGITQSKIKTSRLEVAYLEAGAGEKPVVLIHGNVSSSAFFQDFMLALGAIGPYKIYAPDLRGYGDTETLPLDATRGMGDFADDLAAWAEAMNLSSFHALGWSMGGDVLMQLAIDHPEMLRSITLESAGSPFGFGGSKGPEGSPTWPDYAGSGGGTANPEFVKSLQEGDRGDGQFSARTTMNTFYFKPPFRVAPEREEMYVDSMLLTKVTPGNYPGDMTTSENWPTLAPGTQGVNNALSPKYLNLSAFANINPKPPVLWIRGADDQIVSDTSFFDFGYLGQLGFVPGWPGMEAYPPQPMITQVRTVLDKYKANDGEYREIILPDCGHSPHIEKHDDFLTHFVEFIGA